MLDWFALNDRVFWIGCLVFEPLVLVKSKWEATQRGKLREKDFADCHPQNNTPTSRIVSEGTSWKHCI